MENTQREQLENASPSTELLESLILEAVAGCRTQKPAHISSDEDHTSTQRKHTVTVESSGEPPSQSQSPGSDSAGAMVGRRIGPYRVVDWISDGTAGTLYRAKGDDEFTHEVAVKLLKRGIDSEVILKRLQTEITIQIALAKHPNIIPIEDVGTGPDGWIYIAAEHVIGQPIDKYCDRRQLDVRSRLMIFVQACEAVHVAHQHAVIHGDLRPENILVTDREVPKVTGFGIAKLLQFGAGKDETAIDAMSDNPEYVSPEQIMGETITAASDVYALGVILYQILSGHWPYQLTTKSMPEILQAICEQVPEKPSTASARYPTTQLSSRTDLASVVDPTASSQMTLDSALRGEWPVPLTPDEVAAARGLSIRRLNRLLSGELDAIVLMAIRKEPEQRYHSALHFSDDLRRYLKGLPVQAQRDSWTYRARKFSRRHRAATAIGVLSLLAVVVGIIGTTTSAIVARHERNLAGESLDKARRAVDQVFTRVTEEPLFDQPSMHPLRESLLLDVRRFYEDFLKHYTTDHSLRVESALARAHLARIASLTGSRTEAAAHYRASVALWDDLVAEQPDSQFYQGNLVRTLSGLSAALIPLDGCFNEAVSTNRRARELIEPVITNAPPTASDRRELSEILRNSAEIHKLQGQSDEAIKDLESALEIETQLAAENPQSLLPAVSLANAHSALGQLHAGQSGDLLESLESYSHAIQIRETIARDHPELINQSYRLASELSAVSTLQQKLKQPESAFQSLSRSLEISERISQSYPNMINYKETLGASYNTMSDLLRQRGERAEALIFAQKASMLFERLVAQDSQNTNCPLGLAQSHNLIGRLFKEDGKTAKALQSFRRAVDLYESLPQIDPQNSLNLACNLALCIPLIGTMEGSPSSGGSPQELSKADGRRRNVYGDRAIEALRSAAGGGLLDIEMLETNPDLNSLRVRADFRSLLKEVEEKRVTAGN
jgi:eukaryotic-like serine/threonine-protein kinase